MKPVAGLGWRSLAVGLAATLALALGGCGEAGRRTPPAQEIVFAILPAEGQAAVEPLWKPFLDDMSRAVGAPVTARFGSSYAELVEAMERGDVQAAWFSAQPAIAVIDQADAEVLARTVDPTGEDSYRAVLIARAGSGVDLERAVACDRSLRLGLGDEGSTSGRLAPMAFLFEPQRVDPDRCFASVRTANHQDNATAVAAGALDLAATNSVTVAALAQRNPQLATQIQEIWRSGPIPEGAVVARGDLDPATKEKMRGFLLSYGQGDSIEAGRQRQTLAALGYSRFRDADEAYLDPVREMMAVQALAGARRRGDRAAVRAAEQQLQKLRVSREVQP